MLPRGEAVPATQRILALVAALALVVWLPAWVLLDFVLHNRDQPAMPWATGLLAGVGLATTPLGPPVCDFPTCG
jgi:hypothetical protein